MEGGGGGKGEGKRVGRRLNNGGRLVGRGVWGEGGRDRTGSAYGGEGKRIGGWTEEGEWWREANRL